MGAPVEYKGVVYTISNNDDGAWRWIVHPKRFQKVPPSVVPRPTYQSRSDAIAAVERAIDAISEKQPASKTVPDNAEE